MDIQPPPSTPWVGPPISEGPDTHHLPTQLPDSPYYHHHLDHTSSVEEQRCLEESRKAVPPDGDYCNASWDTLYCWPATPAGTTVKESCATVFSDVPDLLQYPDAFAYRECNGSGVWLWGGWTNYSQCVTIIEHQDGSPGVREAVRHITFIGALLSLLTLSITGVIFTFFRSLECDRLRVHRNLVVALIARFVVMLVFTEPFISHRHGLTYRDLDWLCKTLLALRMYAQMASINWMFVEGLFLHSRLTSHVFDAGAPFTLYYVIGWGCPLVLQAAWTCTMVIHHPVRCWHGYSSLPYIWILVAPMITALMINLLFLVNIVRILVTKLQARDAQLRKAVRATAVLFPLLGTTNLLFAVNPGDKGDLEGAYMLTNAFLQSSQGVFVSVLYCFLNGEVQELLWNRWQQYRIQKLSQPGSLHRRSTRGTIIFDPSLSLQLSPKTPTSLQISPQTPFSQPLSPPSPSSPSPSSPPYISHTPSPKQISSQPLSIQAFDLQTLKQHIHQVKPLTPLVFGSKPCSDHYDQIQDYTEHGQMNSSV